MTLHLIRSMFSGVLVSWGLGTYFEAHEPVVRKLCTQVSIVSRLGTLPWGGILKHRWKARVTAIINSLLGKNSSPDYVAIATNCQAAAETSRPPTLWRETNKHLTPRTDVQYNRIPPDPSEAPCTIKIKFVYQLDQFNRFQMGAILNNSL